VDVAEVNGPVVVDDEDGRGAVGEDGGQIDARAAVEPTQSRRTGDHEADEEYPAVPGRDRRDAGARMMTERTVSLRLSPTSATSV
jgi:hypothetical protein